MSLPRAVAVVLEGRRVLVIKRHLNGRDYAVLPGGGVEIGETVAVAALRELREETTLDALSVQPAEIRERLANCVIGIAP